MDLDSDVQKLYTSEDTKDEEEPCPPSRWSPISQPHGPDFSASSSEDEDENGRKWDSFAIHSTDKRQYMLDIITYYDFCISWTIIGMELTGEMTDCGKYETCLKL